MPDRCSHPKCRADIFRLKHEGTGNIAPIDMEPVDGGNIEIDVEAGTYRIIPKDDRLANPKPRHLNHWATCAAKEEFRKKYPAKAKGQR